MLVPMGIVNEYHEPTTFNGVERPSLDSKIVPTTWREIGMGVSGRINNASIRYQAYLMNGFYPTVRATNSEDQMDFERVVKKGLNLLGRIRILLVESNIMVYQISNSVFRITQEIPKPQHLI